MLFKPTFIKACALSAFSLAAASNDTLANEKQISTIIRFLDHSKAVVDHFLGVPPVAENETHIAYRYGDGPVYLHKDDVNSHIGKALLVSEMFDDLAGNSDTAVNDASIKLYQIFGTPKDTFSPEEQDTMQAQLEKVHNAYKEAEAKSTASV